MIRSATAQDAPILTGLSHQSKNYWDYPQEYFLIWEDELNITSEYIDEHQVFVYEVAARIIAFYSVVELEEDICVADVQLEKGFWLDHMFVDPMWIGKGIGRSLFAHLGSQCMAQLIKKVRILADPHSGGFYDKMGCIYAGEYPSTIAGRTTPLYILEKPGV